MLIHLCLHLRLFLFSLHPFLHFPRPLSRQSLKHLTLDSSILFCLILHSAHSVSVFCSSIHLSAQFNSFLLSPVCRYNSQPYQSLYQCLHVVKDLFATLAEW
jgi:hypothetical protein